MANSEPGRSPNAEYFTAVRRKRTSRLRRFQKRIDAWIAAAVRWVYTPLAARMRRSGARFAVISNPDRIGHLAVEPDWYLKKVALGDLPECPVRLLVRRDKVANGALLDLWADRLEVVSSPLRRRLLKPLMGFRDLVIDLGEGVVSLDHAADYADVNARWGDRPPLVRLPDELRARGQATLRSWGLAEDDWFVCVHAREGGYAPKSEYVHAHRNSDATSYARAIDAIIARGGWAIRVGDPSMKPLPARDRFVDYAVSPEKSAEMDVFLGAACRFFLGNTSGLCNAASIFGVPCVLVNMIPLGAAFGMGASDISIPKLLTDSTGRTIGFREIFASDLAIYRAAELFAAAGVRIVDNTAEEIRDAAEEMMDRLDGTLVYRPEDDALQGRFRALMRPEHYCSLTVGRIGRAFLAQHAHLLEDTR